MHNQYVLTQSSADKFTLTVKQFADRMQISLPTAYAMTEQAGFPLLRVGVKKLIPVAALETWLAKQAGSCNA